VYRPHELCPNGITAEHNYELTMERCRQIEEQGFEVRKFWECEVEAMMCGNREMKEFMDSIPDTSTIISPREAFMGGRVAPLSLKCDLTEIPGALDHFQLNYYDIVSLYPSVNFYSQYPIGHPKVIVENVAVQWRSPSDYDWRGLLKVFVVPPRELLLLPVLALRIGQKLIFPLCRTCAEHAEKNIAWRLSYSFTSSNPERCSHHREEERGFVTTTTHVELDLALKHGYIVTHFYT